MLCVYLLIRLCDKCDFHTFGMRIFFIVKQSIRGSSDFVLEFKSNFYLLFYHPFVIQLTIHQGCPAQLSQQVVKV